MVRKNIVGKRIKQARLSENPRATLKDISARLSVLGISLSDSSVGKIEKAERSVSDIQAAAFAKALKVNINWLFEEDEKSGSDQDPR